MRVRAGVPALILAMVLAACSGGSGTPTQAAGGDGGQATPGAQPTDAGEASQPGDGGGGGGGGVLPGNGSGKVTYEISGPVQKTGELPFFGLGSRFGGEAGASFTFTKADGTSTEIVSVFPDIADTTRWLVSYVSEEFQVSATGCEVSGVQTSDTSASGSFDCQNAIVTNASGLYDPTGRIKGTFEAHK